MNSDRMFELAQALAVAKSRQDVPAALAVLHDDMLLETPAFGTSARGLAENAKVLTRFFLVPGLQRRAGRPRRRRRYARLLGPGADDHDR
jgi:hypothetical protein